MGNSVSNLCDVSLVLSILIYVRMIKQNSFCFNIHSGVSINLCELNIPIIADCERVDGYIRFAMNAGVGNYDA